MKDEALRLALEALEEIAKEATTAFEDAWCGDIANDALTAIKQALEQPEPEPVAWLHTDFYGKLKLSEIWPPQNNAFPVYTHPPKREQERFFCERCGKRLSGGIHTCTPPAEAGKQEPVATVYEGAIAKWNLPEKFTGFLYSSPPKREPLTDVQIATLYWGATGQSLRPQDNALAHKFARAIEAAHGIKGEA